MSSYVVLARKWRPSQFTDIVGQSHIVRTLMNAIRAQRIHQAYLLTGSRGIGKTSIARIFAKAVRCENVQWIDGALKSCDECASCREIAAGTSVDVMEIDGASNNGVEAVREIRENVKYLPSSGTRKIYIVDEVHMLTTAAFNALLKTLEEPPAHIIFIFATTEPHKIPATILSRCQRFDLRRVTMAQIQGRLIQVTHAEGIQAEAGALALIARAAEGSMRDALSLLDQVIAFAGNEISTQAARDSIGLIEGQSLLGILEAVLARKPKDALALVEQAYQQGHDLRVLARSLIEFLYGSILALIDSPALSSPFSEDEWLELKRLSALRPLEEMEWIFQALHHGMDWIARSPQPKIVLDVLLIKCATAETLVSVADLSETGGSAPAVGGGTASSVISYPVGGGSGPTAGMKTTAAGAATVTRLAGPTDTVRSNEAGAAAEISAPLSHQEIPTLEKPAPSEAPRLSPFASSASRPSTASTGPVLGTQASSMQTASAQAAASMAGSAVQAPAGNASSGTRPTPALPSGPRTWEGFIAYARQSRPLLATLLENGACETAHADLLEICYNSSANYYREQVQSRAAGEQLFTLAKEYFGPNVKVRIEMREMGESLATRRERDRKDKEQAARQAARTHPLITEAQSLFGGELGPIELNDPDGYDSGGGFDANA